MGIISPRMREEEKMGITYKDIIPYIFGQKKMRIDERPAAHVTQP